MMKIIQKIGISFVALSLIGSMFAVQAGAIGPIKTWGPVHSSSPDSGTCGNFWAQDTFDRLFSMYTEILPVGGHYQVREDFLNGTFVTNEGQSPEGCGLDLGGVVGAGVTGTITKGFFSILISNGVYNSHAVCTQLNCDTTADFVATVFGPQATFTIPHYSFTYVTPNNGTWVDADTGDSGDITGNP